MLTIHGDRRSGNCLKVLYLADRLELAYRWRDVDILAGETRTPAFLELNPAGQIPVVQFEDGRCLAQSNAIVLHLAQGTDLMPRDAWQEAKVMEWLFWEQYSHEPNIAVCRYQKLYLGRADDELDPSRVDNGNRALDRMNEHLRDHPWLVGTGLTVADICLVPYTRLAAEGGFDLSSRPALRRWIGAVEGELGI